MAYDDRETGLTVEDRGSKLGLPQNQDAEANVLAAMLLSPEVVEEAPMPHWGWGETGGPYVPEKK